MKRKRGEQALRTYIVGRSEFADIKLAATSVAARHAELVVTGGGRFHLTDCASGRGTWLRAATANGTEDWARIRQAFVAADADIRFGDHCVTVRQLVAQVESEGPVEGGGRWRSGLLADKRGGRVRGRVERDPTTGEIVRKRV